MKKTYICPQIDALEAIVEEQLLAGSAQGTQVFDDEADASGVLSRFEEEEGYFD